MLFPSQGRRDPAIDTSVSVKVGKQRCCLAAVHLLLALRSRKLPAKISSFSLWKFASVILDSRKGWCQATVLGFETFIRRHVDI